MKDIIPRPGGIKSAIRLVKEPLLTLENGRAKISDLLIISRKSTAQTGDQIKNHTNKDICPCHSWVAFSGMADDVVAGIGDDGRLLAGDAMRLHQP